MDTPDSYEHEEQLDITSGAASLDIANSVLNYLTVDRRASLTPSLSTSASHRAASCTPSHRGSRSSHLHDPSYLRTYTSHQASHIASLSQKLQRLQEHQTKQLAQHQTLILQDLCRRKAFQACQSHQQSLQSQLAAALHRQEYCHQQSRAQALSFRQDSCRQDTLISRLQSQRHTLLSQREALISQQTTIHQVARQSRQRYHQAQQGYRTFRQSCQCHQQSLRSQLAAAIHRQAYHDQQRTRLQQALASVPQQNSQYARTIRTIRRHQGVLTRQLQSQQSSHRALQQRVAQQRDHFSFLMQQATQRFKKGAWKANKQAHRKLIQQNKSLNDQLEDFNQFAHRYENMRIRMDALIRQNDQLKKQLKKATRK